MSDDKQNPPKPTITNLTDNTEAGPVVAGSHVGAVSTGTARAIVRDVGAAFGKPSPSINDLVGIDDSIITAGSHVGAIASSTVRLVIDDVKKSIAKHQTDNVQDAENKEPD